MPLPSYTLAQWPAIDGEVRQTSFLRSSTGPEGTWTMVSRCGNWTHVYSCCLVWESGYETTNYQQPAWCNTMTWEDIPGSIFPAACPFQSSFEAVNSRYASYVADAYLIEKCVMHWKYLFILVSKENFTGICLSPKYPCSRYIYLCIFTLTRLPSQNHMHSNFQLLRSYIFVSHRYHKHVILSCDTLRYVPK